jgi:patatin-like phospholipase/acyl hydrolase
MRILSLDGGGILGLATAAFLRDAEEYFGRTCHDQFDFFCGTSTGAIIAIALASGHSAEQVVDFYTEAGPRIFRQWVPGFHLLRRLWSPFRPMYDNHALSQALSATLKNASIDSIAADGKYLLVPAFCLSTGRPRVFKTDHSAALRDHGDYRLQDVALASSAAPIYFPAVEIRNPKSGATEQFIDGGVFANDPALLAFAEATYELGVASQDIEILSVSTPRSPLAEAHAGLGLSSRVRLQRGLFRWGGELASVLIDSTSTIHSSTLKRLCGSGERSATYERFELSNVAGLAMDRPSRRALNTLVNVGSSAAADTDSRSRLSVFFSDART